MSHSRESRSARIDTENDEVEAIIEEFEDMTRSPVLPKNKIRQRV